MSIVKNKNQIPSELKAHREKFRKLMSGQNFFSEEETKKLNLPFLNLWRDLIPSGVSCVAPSREMWIRGFQDWVPAVCIWCQSKPELGFEEPTFEHLYLDDPVRLEYLLSLGQKIPVEGLLRRGLWKCFREYYSKADPCKASPCKVEFSKDLPCSDLETLKFLISGPGRKSLVPNMYVFLKLCAIAPQELYTTFTQTSGLTLPCGAKRLGLNIAVKNGNLDVFQILYSSGVRQLQNEDPYPTEKLLVENDRADMLKIALESKGRPRDPSLERILFFQAASYGAEKCLRYLKELNPELSPGENSDIYLLEAMMRGKYEAVDYLLTCGFKMGPLYVPLKEVHEDCPEKEARLRCREEKKVVRVIGYICSRGLLKSDDYVTLRAYIRNVRSVKVLKALFRFYIGENTVSPNIRDHLLQEAIRYNNKEAISLI